MNYTEFCLRSLSISSVLSTNNLRKSFNLIKNPSAKFLDSEELLNFLEPHFEKVQNW